MKVAKATFIVAGENAPPPHPPQSLNDSADTDLRGLMVVLQNKVNN